MNIYRFFRWFMSTHIDAELQLAIAAERIACVALVKTREQAAYLKGHEDGRQAAWESLEAEQLTVREKSEVAGAKRRMTN